jgi:hypothetical protein
MEYTREKRLDERGASSSKLILSTPSIRSRRIPKKKSRRRLSRKEENNIFPKEKQ